MTATPLYETVHCSVALLETYTTYNGGFCCDGYALVRNSALLGRIVGDLYNLQRRFLL